MRAAQETRDRLEMELSTAVAQTPPDHAVLHQLSERLATAQTDLESAEGLWLDLAADAESRGLSIDGDS
jgi:hypothetical protein